MRVHISRRPRHSSREGGSEEAAITGVFPVAKEKLGLMGKKQVPSIDHRHSSAEGTMRRSETEASAASSLGRERAWSGEERRSVRRGRHFVLLGEEAGRVEETGRDEER